MHRLFLFSRLWCVERFCAVFLPEAPCRVVNMAACQCEMRCFISAGIVVFACNT